MKNQFPNDVCSSAFGIFVCLKCFSYISEYVSKFMFRKAVMGSAPLRDNEYDPFPYDSFKDVPLPFPVLSPLYIWQPGTEACNYNKAQGLSLALLVAPGTSFKLLRILPCITVTEITPTHPSLHQWPSYVSKENFAETYLRNISRRGISLF